MWKKVSMYFKLQSDKLLASLSHWKFSSQVSICRHLWPVFCLIYQPDFLSASHFYCFFLSIPSTIIHPPSIHPKWHLVKELFHWKIIIWTTKNTLYDWLSCRSKSMKIKYKNIIKKSFISETSYKSSPYSLSTMSSEVIWQLWLKFECNLD